MMFPDLPSALFSHGQDPLLSFHGTIMEVRMWLDEPSAFRDLDRIANFRPMLSLARSRPS